MTVTEAGCQYLPVNWPAEKTLCIAFRRDAWHVSNGTLEGFSETGTSAWFETIASDKKFAFLHVWQENQIVGQIEYRAPITTADGDQSPKAYINLFYLTPSKRGLGLGQAMHDFVMNDLRSKNCHSVRLRVIEGNITAQRFYAKNGWQKLGTADDKGAQLMEIFLN